MKIITRYWTKGNLFKTVLLSFFLALMMSIVFGNRLGNFAGSIVTVRCIVVTLSGVISLIYYYHMYEQFKSEFYLRITLGDTVAEISECFALVTVSTMLIAIGIVQLVFHNLTDLTLILLALLTLVIQIFWNILLRIDSDNV